MSSDGSIVQLRGINLAYGNFQALKDLSLTVEAGEIHAIVGEHGAGKSSIINVLSGFARPESGRIIVNGKAYRSLSVREAQLEGVSLVKQGVNLCDHLSVAKNIYMNQPAFYRRHRFRKRRATESVEVYLREHEISLDPHVAAGSLKLADKVLTEVVRALYRDPRLLILDESLEKLTADDLERVIRIMQSMRDQGRSVLFVTHRIDDIFQIADRVSVIRHGELLMTEGVDAIDKFSLVKIAYTQLPDSRNRKMADTDFYHLLKYNQAILESLPINLLVVNNDFRLQLVNTEAATFFGIRGGANPGIVLKDLFNDNERLYNRITDKIHRDGSSTLFNERYSVVDGFRILNISIVPIRDESWRIGSILMLEDATEREKLREQIFLSEKIGSIGVLAAGIAHEICNPLEIISNDISYLKTLYGNSIDLAILQEIKEEVESISRIVRNLERIPGERQRRTAAVVPAELAQSVVTFISPVAAQFNTTIEFKDESERGAIIAEADDIRQILLNLIKNALEAAEENGTVRVIVRRVEQYLSIVIEDNGPGISEAEQNMIFLPFFSTKETSGINRGLGLYVTYQLVQRYNGFIDVEINSDGGCTFNLQFELQPVLRLPVDIKT